MAPFAAGFGCASLATAGLSSLFTGLEYEFSSGEFSSSAGGTALGLLTFGQSKWIGAITKAGDEAIAPVATKIGQFGHDLVSPITGTLGSVFG